MSLYLNLKIRIAKTKPKIIILKYDRKPNIPGFSELLAIRVFRLISTKRK
jgi:hypothetical protein